MPKGTVLTVNFELEGFEFMALNAGLHDKFNPSTSFMVQCPDRESIDKLWSKLSEGGSPMMPLDKYPWSERYGWLADKFGLSWQLILSDDKPKIKPCLLFVKESFGKAYDAMKFYTSIFENSQINRLQLYGPDQGGIEGSVMYAEFSVDGQVLSAMDGAGEHNYAFNDAVSFMVHAKTQAELDTYWDMLISDAGKPVQCGWLKDKFGITWQVVPTIIGEMLTSGKPEKTQRMMHAMMEMVKLDIAGLERAYEG